RPSAAPGRGLRDLPHHDAGADRPAVRPARTRAPPQGLTMPARDRTGAALAGAFVVFVAAGFFLPSWAVSLVILSLARGIVALGRTRGCNVPAPPSFGARLSALATRTLLYDLTVAAAAGAALAVHWYLGTILGRLDTALRDNEVRVEYLGYAPGRVIHVQYVLGAALAGGAGALTAMAVGHIDPSMAYWTTSGELVFVTILSGT